MAAIDTLKTSKLGEGNLVVNELDQAYSRKDVTLLNNTGGVATFNVGQTLMTYGFNRVPATADVANAILASCGDENRQSITLADAATASVGVIVGGRIEVNRDALIFADGVSNNHKLAQIALLEARGIKMIREPLKQGYGEDVLTEDSTALIEILSAVSDGFDAITVTFSGNVNAADFSPGDFESNPSGLDGVDVSTSASDALTVLMADNVDPGDVSLTYDGDAPGVDTPQTIDYED